MKKVYYLRVCHSNQMLFNPKYLFYRYDKQNQIFGDDKQNYSHRQMLEWMIIYEEELSIGMAKKWCREHNPKLCMFEVDTNTEVIYTYNGGKQGVQGMLFDMQRECTANEYN